MYHYVYITINRLNQKYYYGIHSTNNLDDGYLGSGLALVNAVRKYGRSLFVNYIIKFHETRLDAVLHEQMIVTDEVTKDPMCYNICKGGITGPAQHTPEAKIRMGWSKGIPHSDTWKENIRSSLKDRPTSQTHRQRISDSWKSRPAVTEHTRTLMSCAHKGKILPRGKNNSNYGSKRCDDTKKLMSDHCAFNISCVLDGVSYNTLKSAYTNVLLEDKISMGTFCTRMKRLHYIANTDDFIRSNRKKYH